jgi:hypothetical protein
MKTYWGVEIQLHATLTSALDGGEWPRLIYPPGKSLGTLWIRGWMGPKTDLDAVVKRKSPTAPTGN